MDNSWVFRSTREFSLRLPHQRHQSATPVGAGTRAFHYHLIMQQSLVLLFLVGGLLSILASYLGVGLLRRWAKQRNMLDIPNERSSHTLPTPTGGGLVIVLISLLGLTIAWMTVPAWSFLMLFSFLSGAILIAAVSWWDDLRSLPNRLRFAAHSLGAIVVILGFGYWQNVDLPVLGPHSLGLWGLPITFLWLVGLTNAYNFMDGIDGIAGGQAVVAGLGWMALGWMSGQPLVSVLGMLLATSSLGFLGHNWPPARIFMGDVGSAFLGFSFAFLAVVAAKSDSRLAFVGVIFVWPFIFDAGFTFVRRLLNRENVFAGHRSHLYQRLVIAGYSHRTVTLLYCFLAILGGALAMFWWFGVPGAGILLVLALPILCLALVFGTTRIESRQHTVITS